MYDGKYESRERGICAGITSRGETAVKHLSRDSEAPVRTEPHPTETGSPSVSSHIMTP
jgi:hypothetical protein